MLIDITKEELEIIKRAELHCVNGLEVIKKLNKLIKKIEKDFEKPTGPMIYTVQKGSNILLDNFTKLS